MFAPLALICALPQASAAEAAPAIPVVRAELVCDGFEMPLYATSAPGQANHLYVLEKAGVIRIVDLKQNKVLEQPFLDIHEKVSTRSERGLLGLAFPADYQKSRLFYLHYSDLEGQTVVARMALDPGDRLQADPKSEFILLTVPQPFANHDGGELVFGPDGMLYLGLGDGGAANDPHNAAQNGRSLLGKILRLQVSSELKAPYRVPEDNPFVYDEKFRDEIWCYGLRNPWRFSFDRDNGDLWIGDVGQNKWEEVDYSTFEEAAGKNYGWRVREARHPFNKSDPQPRNMTEPIHEYVQGGPRNARSVTGGYVYRGKALPQLRGWYLFADYVSGQVYGLKQEGGTTTAHHDFTPALEESLGRKLAAIASFGQDAAGELYLMDLAAGTLYRLH